MPSQRPFIAGKTALEVDGVVCGFLERAAGGAIAADVISVPGQELYDDKHLARVHYEELELQLDLSLDSLIYDWIAASWRGNPSRRDGSIISTDFSGKSVSEREFFRGLVSEVTVPALDAASKDRAYLTVKIAPDYLRVKKADGKAVKSTAGRQKEWLASSFRLEIDALDATRVSAIDAFSVSQSLLRDDVGEVRVEVAELGRLAFSDIRVTVAESGADTWTAWFDDFVVKGNNGQSKERNGKLTFLAADGKTPLGEVSLFNLGIFRLEPEPRDARVESVARLIASLYCEHMELAVP